MSSADWLHAGDSLPTQVGAGDDGRKVLVEDFPEQLRYVFVQFLFGVCVLLVCLAEFHCGVEQVLSVIRVCGVFEGGQGEEGEEGGRAGGCNGGRWGGVGRSGTACCG